MDKMQQKLTHFMIPVENSSPVAQNQAPPTKQWSLELEDLSVFAINIKENKKALKDFCKKRMNR